MDAGDINFTLAYLGEHHVGAFISGEHLFLLRNGPYGDTCLARIPLSHLELRSITPRPNGIRFCLEVNELEIVLYARPAAARIVRKLLKSTTVSIVRRATWEVAPGGHGGLADV